jgi:hypothetical protein
VINNPLSFIDPLGLKLPICADEHHCNISYTDAGAIGFWGGDNFWVSGDPREEPVGISVGLGIFFTGGGNGVIRSFGGTFTCNKSPQAVINYLENNFAAAADWQYGPLSVTFLQKGALTQGSTIYIDGPIGYGLPSHLGGTSAVSVESVGPTSFSFATVPGMHPFDNGTVTFSAAPAPNGQIQFSVNVNAQFSGTMSQVSFNLGGRQLESSIWNHLTQSVQKLCQK